MTRNLRAFVASIVSVVIGASAAGCGTARSVLSIHEAPKANPATVPLSVDQAKRILTRDFTAAQQGEMTTGAVAQAALKTAYTGDALRAATAKVKLTPVRAAGAESPVLAPQQPLLLALSRGFGFPRVMVVQTVGAKGSIPVLHLLTSPDAATPYRITTSATMLPSTAVKPFDPLRKGSQLVTDGAGLVVSDAALLKAYAARMAFPAKIAPNPPFGADSFSAQVRVRATEVAKAVATQASFSQVHHVVPGSAYAVRQANGDALVFGVIERTDSFKVKKGQAVNTAGNQEFVLLSGKKKVTKSASITTLEFVVFAVPSSGGQARLVAASEQVVAGLGS
jgi:hypothetical protein